ncbi:MAG: UDP-N-acetylmuramate--L-alanine ligase [Clostridia bacterium]|nr:UDP-N-acetylmuramate--L-alanine ligase [Clostridia bacterium]
MRNIKDTLKTAKKLHFMGIGGSSMSSLAQIAKRRGYTVSGSDMQESEATDRLQALGISVNVGQVAKNIDEQSPDAVVMTDAISPTNPERLRAEELQIPVYRRAEFLGEILDGYKTTVGIAGTHGKTTTSSMVTAMLLSAQKDPSAIIGGHMNLIGASYRLGEKEDLCVFESCEFKESFRFFRSDVSIILNIGEDHMEYFKTLDNVISAFRNYLNNIKPNGTLVTNAEDENVKKMRNGYQGNLLLFGWNDGHFRGENVTLDQGLPSFDLYYHPNNDAQREFFGRVSLSVPGRHNVLNALACAAAGFALGLTKEEIVKGIGTYNGAGRRFEYHCTVNGAVVADDYGHHPDAYRVTFRTARDLGFQRIIAIHQPHTFSRTKMLMDDFVEVLSTVDKVLIPPIYPARETNDDYNVYAQDVVDRLDNAEFMEDFEHIADRIKELAQPGDLFITLGCGDIYKAAVLTTEKYGEKKFLIK